MSQELQPKCPICRKRRDERFRPFCSKRCADLDLGRWLRGQYAIAVEDESGEDAAKGVDPDAGEDTG
ncbi:MAG: DNA gyrase inhibitor YacG [Alphaproteobacteria bacterium]|nr:DNA gyrase inhibitor YacG [Alphaproteobacteria bacterium]